MTDSTTPRGRMPQLGLDAAPVAAPAAAPAAAAPVVATAARPPAARPPAGVSERRSEPHISTTAFFDEIKRRVSLETYLEEIGVDLIPAGSMLVACCPFHEEKTPSFQVTEGKQGQAWQTWICRGACDTGGTVIDAVMRKEGFDSSLDAAEWLNDHFDLGIERDARWAEQQREFKERVSRYTKESQEGRDEYTQGETRLAQQVHEYLHRRGFSDETITYFQLGASDRRVQIPLVDSGNHVVAVDGRALFDSSACRACGETVTAQDMFRARQLFFRAKDKGETPEPWQRCPHCGASESQSKLAWLADQHPKYKFPKGFDKSEFLFNFHNARRELADQKNEGKLHGLFLTEGYMDTFAVRQAGQSGVCAYNGKKLSLWQAEKICALAVQLAIPIILVPDFDATGRKYVRRNVAMLHGVNPEVEVQVLFSIDQLDADGGKKCKDAGDVLAHQGGEVLARLLLNDRRPAEEWLIREIAELPVTMLSVPKQIDVVAGILASIRHRLSLSYLIPYLAEVWRLDERAVRGWFQSAQPGQIAENEGLFKTVDQAREEAVEWRQHADLIQWGYEELDKSVGGGFRRGWTNLLIAKSGAGKSAIGCQLVAHWAELDLQVIFFSLEMTASQLFERMVCQVLDVDSDTAAELVKMNSPELDRVVALYRNLYVIDNVPTEEKQAVDMTPERVQHIIREANLTKFRDRPTDIVIVDHLGIMACPEDAPKSVKENDSMAEGYKVQALFAVTKATNVYTLLLQQVAKHIKAGVPLEAGDGRGGSKQLDYADQVITAYRPEHEAGIDEAERIARRGLIVVGIRKNRYGPDYLQWEWTFDPATLKILPEWQQMMPIDDLGDSPHIAAASTPLAIGPAPEPLAPVELPAGSAELDTFLGGEVADGELTL